MEFWKSHVVRNVGSDMLCWKSLVFMIKNFSGFQSSETQRCVAGERFSTPRRSEFPSSSSIQGPCRMLLTLFIDLGSSKMNVTLSFESLEPLIQWRILTSRKIGNLEYTAVKTSNLVQYFQPLKIFCKKNHFRFLFCYTNVQVTEKK